MRPPRLEADVEQRVLGHHFHQLEPGHGSAWLLGVERSTRRIAAITPYRGIDPPCSRPRLAAHESGVPSLDLALPNRLLEGRERLLGARDDHQPRRLAVEAMHDARPVGIVTPGRAETEQLRGERASRRAGPRVHGDTGGLVDDDEMLVLVGQVYGGGLRPGGPGRLPAARPRRPSLPRGDGSSPSSLRRRSLRRRGAAAPRASAFPPPAARRARDRGATRPAAQRR